MSKFVQMWYLLHFCFSLVTLVNPFFRPVCVALQFIPKPEAQAVSDQQLMEQILSEDIDHEEVVEYVEVYSVKELGNIRSA